MQRICPENVDKPFPPSDDLGRRIPSHINRYNASVIGSEQSGSASLFEALPRL